VRYPARKPVHATSSSQEVHLITEQDIAESKYTIFDVIMPLPGFDVEYPEGKIGELYEVMMKADGLDPHRMRREQRYVVLCLVSILIIPPGSPILT
jgi:tRNA pseudouridine13 synthase